MTPQDLRVPLTPILAAFGVPATVTRPAPKHQPIPTQGVWVATPIDDQQPHGSEFQRQGGHRVLMVPRSDVDALPLGTLIVAPEMRGGEVRTWKVASLERGKDPECWYASVAKEWR